MYVAFARTRTTVLAKTFANQGAAGSLKPNNWQSSMSHVVGKVIQRAVSQPTHNFNQRLMSYYEKPAAERIGRPAPRAAQSSVCAVQKSECLFNFFAVANQWSEP
ncbi:hypothetical protein ASE69_20745 [Sphingomonas sp. Leaf208]|nr:hypothetical protein ASE69_20745 [Sphingomonas sp. Leaf208]